MFRGYGENKDHRKWNGRFMGSVTCPQKYIRLS